MVKNRITDVLKSDSRVRLWWGGGVIRADLRAARQNMCFTLQHYDYFEWCIVCMYPSGKLHECMPLQRFSSILLGRFGDQRFLDISSPPPRVTILETFNL